MIGIYKITSPSGRVYIGSSNNINKRRNIYKNLRCKSQPRIYSSLVKYGYDNHRFEVIEECNLNDLDDREIFWINFYKCTGKLGLNVKSGGKRGSLSKEAIERMRKSKTGKKLTEEHKKKISNSLKGRIISEQARLNMSLSRKGIKFSEERKIKLRGRTFTEKHKKKISKALSGRTYLDLLGSEEKVKTRIDKFRKSFNGKLNKPIICLNDGKIFESIKQTAEYFKVSPSVISNIVLGKIEKLKSGFTFKYYK